MNNLLQQQDFKLLFDSTLDAIMVADDNGVYLAVNHAACEMLKAPESSILGRTVADFLPPETHEYAQDAWKTFLEAGQRSGEIDLLRADGCTCTVEFSARANFLPGQHLSVLRDISKRKKAEAALVESNNQIVSILESVSDAVLAFDTEWRFLYTNPQSETILGRAPSSVIGKSLWEIYPATLGTIFEENYLKAVRENRPVQFEGFSPDLEMWLEVHVYPSRVGVTVYLRDINESKRARDNLSFLSEAGACLSSSLDHGEVISSIAQLTISYLADWCSVDIVEDGEIKRLAVVHKDTAKVELGHEFRRLYPPKLDDTNGVALVLRTGEPQLWKDIPDEQLVAIAPDEVWLQMMRNLGMKSIILVPLVSQGQTIGVMSLVREQQAPRFTETDLVVAQELGRRAGGAVENGRLFRARTEALRMAEEASRAKDEFLAIVSHELKTPMTPILGWIGLLKDGASRADPSILDHALEVVERNVRAQSQLVNDLLDISRIVTGKLQLNLRQANLPEIVRFAIETVQPAAQAKGVELILNLNDEIPPVAVDAERIQQVVWNLLSNAIKFTPAGGLVAASLQPVDGFVEFRVRDTGQGIRREFLPYVFERFRQADSSSSREHGGLGLGLSIVRNVVELHGGSVTADSQGVGVGATFTVRLPTQDKSASARGKSAQASSSAKNRDPHSTLSTPLASSPSPPATSSESSASLAPQLNAPLRGLRILLIEDMQDIRDMVVAILKLRGAEVRETGTTDEGMNWVQRWSPHIILCDIGLPGEDGYAFLKRVRALPEESPRRTPAIALTAYSRAEDRDTALAVGYQAHIAKPVRPDELVDAILKVVQQH